MSDEETKPGGPARESGGPPSGEPERSKYESDQRSARAPEPEVEAAVAASDHSGDGTPDGGPPPGSPDAMGAVQVTARSRRGRYLVHVRYGALPTTGTATTTISNFGKDDPLILRTNRGTEFGVAVTDPEPVDGDIGEAVGHVLRKAATKDLAQQRRIEEDLEPEESRFCKKKISERGLRMRLSSVEHMFGGERIVFYFTAERRVDFRALVRDLAWHFHTRIELRQIGARDEARLLADFEHCGRPLCCKVFLRHLEPVTMRMAKLQRTTLDPQKISGRCGRLMCCLRFEDEVYKELRKGLPHKGTRVHVGEHGGEVVSTDILTQRATVRIEDGDIVRVPVKELRPPESGEREAEAGRGEGARAPSGPAGAAPSRRGEHGGGRSGRGGRGEKPGRRGPRRRTARQQKPTDASARGAQQRRSGPGPRAAAGDATRPAPAGTDGARRGPGDGEGDRDQAGQPGQTKREGRRRSQGRRRRGRGPRSSEGSGAHGPQGRSRPEADERP